MKHRLGIEPEIGHQKSDGKLGLNWLKGVFGDAQIAILCAAGHKLKMILATSGIFTPHLRLADGRHTPMPQTLASGGGFA